MNILSIFVLIPLLMLLGLWLSRNIKQIRMVMVTGASALVLAAVGLTIAYLQARAAGDTAEMLFRADVPWYPALNIHYSVGVDGYSVAMLLLSAIYSLQPVLSACLASATVDERIFPLVHLLSLVCSASSFLRTCSPCSCSMK